MSIEGDLKDIELGTIVQAVCMERRKSRLQLNYREQEGSIYFDNGEVVHASLDQLEGAEAIYKLLTWNSGWFRLTEQGHIPRRTIRKNWHHLLLDGLRMIDERQRNLGKTPRRSKQPSVSDLKKDELLENELIFLMSRLEQTMYGLSKIKERKLPKATLEALCHMVNEVVGFCEGSKNEHAAACSLKQALVKVVTPFPQTRILQNVGNQLSVRTLLNLYKTWADRPLDRNQYFLRVCLGICAVLGTFFSEMGRDFLSRPMRNQWAETYNVFLGELRRSIDRVPF